MGKKRSKHPKQSTIVAPPRASLGSMLATMWPRLLAVFAGSALAFILIGMPPIVGGTVVRALVAGLVAGLCVRTWNDLLPTVVASGLGVAMASTGLGTFYAANGATPAASDLIAAPLVVVLVAAGFGAIALLAKRAWFEWVALALVAVAFGLSIGVLPGQVSDATAGVRSEFATEPQAEQYNFDGALFLRTEYLMEHGTPYYDAYIQAFDGDSRLQGTPPGLFNIRQPWLFWMWRYLPGTAGVKIRGWFAFWALVTAGCGYLLARRFVEPGIALLAPIALCGYLSWPMFSTWLTLSEFWAGCVAVWFLTAMVYRRWLLGALLMVVAFALRELLLFLVPVYLVWWFAAGRPKKAITGVAIAVLGPFTLLGLHAMWSPVHAQSGGGLAFWLQGGLPRLIDALRFSGGLVPLSAVLYLLAPVAALAGALLAKPRWAMALLGAAVLVPVIALAIFSNGQWGYYWGAIAMPSILALVPLAATRLMPAAVPLEESAVR